MQSELHATVQRDMQAWMERAVIGLNLCPFAKAVQTRGLVHYAVSEAESPAAVLADLRRELLDLVALDAAERDTTLLMVPFCLDGFFSFNAFLKKADRLLRALELEGVVQIASFHPAFEFGDAPPEDPAHHTNRAPYPTLHLLRESSVERAVAAFPQAETIYERNIETLRRLGASGWKALGIARHLPGRR